MNRPCLRRVAAGVWRSPWGDVVLRRVEGPPGPRGGRRILWTVDGLDGAFPTLAAAAEAHRDRIEGKVYLIHLERPFKHARHYLGWTVPGGVERRLAEHRAGQGANLLRHVSLAGIAYDVVRVWPGDRHLERRLKRRGDLGRLCPRCQGEIRLQRNATARARYWRDRAFSAVLSPADAQPAPEAA